MPKTGLSPTVIEAVRNAFHRERQLGPQFRLSRIEAESDGALVLEGEVRSLAQKKLALFRAAAVPGVSAVIDRVHVAPAAAASDRHIRAQLRELFAQHPDFEGFAIREDAGQRVFATEYVPVAGAGRSGIDIEVKNGIVTLNGALPSLVHKRLAGAMAWWIPGVRDVVNGIAVDPPEEDGPDQIEEAVRTVLDRNASVDAEQIKVGVRGTIVRLTGLVHSEAARQIAEMDAWAVFGVDEVINEIEVRK